MKAPASRPILPFLAAAFGLITGSASASISFVQITGDADSNISTDNIYTHTLDFGTGTPGATINGLTFDAYNAGANGTLNFTRTVSSGKPERSRWQREPQCHR